MTRQELEQWLCGASGAPPTVGDLAVVVDLLPDAADGVSRLELARRLVGGRFLIAVLRDVFADDHGVRRWLRTPRPEFDGLCGVDLLCAGESDAVETLAVRQWHRPERDSPYPTSFVRTGRSS